jgi:hypothetical protein
VWDEARKALVTAEFTDQEGNYRYETMLYERDLDRETRLILGEEQSRRRGRMRTPFGSKPAEDLVENGFVRSSATETLYYAPDAAVLLSDVFLDSHCFRLERADENEEASGLIGLAFEPSGDRRRIPDIAGTLWLDPETSELRWLEYRYENLDPDISSDDVGGRIDFRRMPRGTWIVPEWWIRMPQVEMRSDLGGRMRQSVTGFRQSGGRVISVQDDIGRSVVRSRATAIEGVVHDSLGSSPLPGVRVGVVGANQQVFTNAEGRFRIINLSEGIYQIRFVDPALEAWGFTPEPITRDVHRGEVTSVVFRMPPLSEFLLGGCRNDPSQEEEKAVGTGVLAGWVQDAVTGERLPGATVRVAWDNYEVWPGFTWMGIITDVSSYEATADARGFYQICAVPEFKLLTVVGASDGVESKGDTLRILGDFEAARLHTVSVPRVRR